MFEKERENPKIEKERGPEDWEGTRARMIEKERENQKDVHCFLPPD